MGRKLRPGIDKIGEDWVKKEIKDRLDRFETLHFFMPPASEYGRSGTHDIIVCQCGLFWSIEAKAGKNPATDNQIKFANAVYDAKGLSICVNEFNLDDVIRVAAYVETFNELPYFLNHDFDKYTK